MIHDTQPAQILQKQDGHIIHNNNHNVIIKAMYHPGCGNFYLYIYIYIYIIILFTYIYIIFTYIYIY